MTTYAVGLRLSEVSRLQVEDVDSSRMVIHDMRPREPVVNCRILPIIPVRVEMAINRSGNHWQMSVKLTAGSTREGDENVVALRPSVRLDFSLAPRAYDDFTPAA